MAWLVALLVGRGLSEFVARVIVYALIVAMISGVLLGIRQHYVNLGWYKHKAAVEKQDNKAIDASKEVEQKTQKCSDDNGFWDVITQGCKLQEEESK
jgi:hypothetical protein